MNRESSPFDLSRLEAVLVLLDETMDDAGALARIKVMEHIEAEAARRRQPKAPAHVSSLLGREVYTPVSDLSRAYGEQIPDVQALDVVSRVATQPISADLDVQELDQTVEVLRQLRRQLAAQTHPDRVEANLRAAASERMGKLNAAIDAAIERAIARDETP